MESELHLLKAQQSISINSAKQLSITTNTAPQIPSLSPRWLLRFLPWEDVNSGIYRINQVQYLRESHKLTLPIQTQTLSTIPLFKELPNSYLDTLLKGMQTKEVGPNEVIVKEGEKKGSFYVILDGQFDVSIKGRHGGDLIIKSLGSGDYFGEMALLQDMPRQATVTSRITGTMLTIDQKTFKKIFNTPETKRILQEAIKERKKELQIVNQYGETQAPLMAGHLGEPGLPKGFVSYRETPREIHLSVIQTIVSVLTRITDVYNSPHDQLEQQLRITIENIREREEWEIINNTDFGLLSNVDPSMMIETRNGEPTPDDLDELISLVWKKPSFFLAHPVAIAAFGRECTFRGVPPPTTEILGGQFMTWRGIPLIPSNKLPINQDKDGQKTDIILMRIGKENQGVVGLHKASLGAKNIPSLTIQHMGTNEHSIANYLLTKYFSVAIQVPDALGVLKNVELGKYHKYD
ncbi:MAG: family 2B encapsulin nanocompartment shell protein [Candidatus Berkiella sp.]